MDSTSDITVSIAAPEDSRGLAAVQKVAWLATYPNEESGITAADLLEKDFDSPERIKLWESRMTNPGNVRTWAAKTSGGNVVGFIGARREEPTEIVALYVHPDYQGQRIGRRLMETALGWIGATPVELHVVAYNHRAIRFYESFGFKPGGPTQAQSGILPNGKVLPEIKMVRATHG